MNENCRVVYVCEGLGGLDFKTSLGMWNVIATLFSLRCVATVVWCSVNLWMTSNLASVFKEESISSLKEFLLPMDVFHLGLDTFDE